MTQPKLHITDARMILAPAKLKADGRIRFRQQFLDAAGLLKGNFRNVKTGAQHFTAAHIANVCKEFGINANWIMGIEKNFYRVK